MKNAGTWEDSEGEAVGEEGVLRVGNLTVVVVMVGLGTLAALDREYGPKTDVVVERSGGGGGEELTSLVVSITKDGFWGMG